jgi:hypothetical protein
MNLTSLPRAAVGGYIKAVRWPIDRALRLRGGDGDGKLAVDRAEAAARDVAATALGDQELKAEAGARFDAAERRERAQDLEAQARREAAEAEQRRNAAQQEARERKRLADRERQQRKRAAARAERDRKAAAEEVVARAHEGIDEQAKRDRLEQLDQEAAAQTEREQALTARDEARRLATATADAKAARKG